MRITGDGVWGEHPDPEGCRRLLARALELGVNLIDTADSYGPGVSERLIAEALHPYPDELVIATKGGLTRTGPGQWPRDGRPEHLREAIEGSLRRLRLERIHLYQLHAVDPAVPLEESVGTLADLRAEGKIDQIGVCNVDVDQLDRARRIVDVVSVQNRYNLSDRESEAVLQVCERDGLAFLPWFPIARGTLAEGDGPLGQVAADHGATPAQVALAWLLQHSPVTVPIPGTASIEHLEENVAAAAIELSEDDVAMLEAGFR